MALPSLPDRRPIPPGRRGGRRRLWALSLSVLAAALSGGRAQADSEEDLEPRPPWVFFTQPDEEAARLIDGLFENSFGDLNKAVTARDLLVRRFGVWSVPRLKAELDAAQNDSGVLNATLTVIALRGAVGPAPELLPLIKPLVEAARHTEPWRRAAAALALGAFHGPDGLGYPRRYADQTHGSDPLVGARRVLEGEGLTLLEALLQDPNAPVRVAAYLALGRTGGARARARLETGAPARDAAVEPRMARYVALGLLPLPLVGDYDDSHFLRGLGDEETRVRAGAALGAALQALSDAPPPWTATPERVLRAFGTAAMSTGKSDTAEALFARGCLAWLRQRPDEWAEILGAATEPLASLEVAQAAAQVLLWCEEPALRARALGQLTGNRRALSEPVLASFLLRAGYDGSPEGVRACREWLGNPSLGPASERDWDVRWHAAIGLLRAFSAGRIAGPETRKAALEALDVALEKGLRRDTPLFGPLSDLLRKQRPLLLASPDHRLPEEEVRAVEASVRCRYGLLAHDLRGAAIERANTMVRDGMFQVGSLRALKPGAERDKEGSSKRFFERFLSAWPYLSRLDLQAGRGRRPPEALRYDLPEKVLNR